MYFNDNTRQQPCYKLVFSALQVTDEFRYTPADMVHVGDIISQSTNKPAASYEQSAMDEYLNKGGLNKYPNNLRSKI